ncbi:uncharacterized protein LOC8272343 [Ricinus communis]|uniref:Uncharacterized protein n=1 Tax=Ricinus communis TaxID=3988 RepID=B9S5G2_RICCO|nr:uncharacterized protein LOC8272343 [Ricinus communis]EEF41183.1 conserved hypothetical protein [Ricinus communis]|eukprot:XP_002521231.1 uncharacterized protein LOC8272343 [Ricinus communis]
MKRAKVSPLYEGRRRKRSIEEKEYSSRRARIIARARKHGHKSNLKALYKCITTGLKIRNYITDQEVSMLKPEPIIETAEISKSKIDHVKIGDNARNGIKSAKMEKWEGAAEWWEEWPFCWSYEEQWMWLGADCNCCGRPWEVMGGDLGLANGEDKEESWGEDVWNLRAIKDILN